MKTIVPFLIAAFILAGCKTTSVSEGDASTAIVEPTPVPKTSIDTSKPETIAEAAVKKANVDDDTKAMVEKEIAKRKLDKSDADGLLEEAKKHISEDELESAVKKLKSAIGNYGE